MDSLRLQAVAARLVAWHNRHPFARRITAADVRSIGYVALPCRVAGPAPASGPAGAVPAPGAAAPRDAGGQAATPTGAAQDETPASRPSLRERLLARAPDAAPPAARPAAPPVLTAALEPHFSEAFIPGLAPGRIARWARRQIVPLPHAPADAPLREVKPDPLPAGESLHLGYLLTASIESGGRASRVLLGPGEEAAVLGRRLASPSRIGAASMVPAGLLAASIAWRSLPEPAPPLAVAPPLPAASGAASAAESPRQPEPVRVAASGAAAVAPGAPVVPVAAPAASAPPPGAPAAEAMEAASAAASAPAAAAAAASAPLDVEPRLGRIELPPIVPGLAHLRRPRAAAASAPAAVPVAVVPGPVWAISTRLLRTRTEAEQHQAAIRTLLAPTPAAGAQVELLRQGDDWRVVGFPFESEAKADAALAVLAARGMRVKVIPF